MKRLRQALNRQRRKENKREEVEKWLRYTVEASPVGMMAVNDEGRVVVANSQIEHMFGYTKEELFNLPVQQLIPERFRPIHLSHIENFLENPMARPMVGRELFAQRKDGTEFLAEIGLSSLNTVERIFILVSIVDATQRWEVEQALREGEAKYRSLVEQTPGAVYSAELGPEGSWFYASPQIETLTGFPPEAWLADPELWFRQLHPDDRSHAKEVEEKVQETGERLAYEYRMFTRDGREIWVRDEGVITRNTEDTNFISLGFLIDITERKQAELALQKAEAKYRALVEQLPGVVYQDAINELATTRFISPQVEEMLGYATEDWLDDPELWVKLLHPEDREQAVEANALHNATGKPFDMDYRLIARDGRVIWVRDQAVIVRNEAGEPEISQGVLIDITEQKRVESERQALIQIMYGAITSTDLTDFLGLVHRFIANIVYAENFFVALLNKATGLFEEIYTVDKYDQPAGPFELGRSLSAYVFRTGESLLVSQEQFDMLVAQGEVELVGTNSPSWLGVPLKIPGETIGVMVVQHYEELDCYTERDVEFLASIAGQIGLVVESKRAAEALIESEALFRLLFASNPLPMWVYDLQTLVFLEVNDSAIEQYGYSREEFLRMGLPDIRPPEEVPRLIENILQARPALQHSGPWKHRKKNGQIIDVEITSHTLSFAGRNAALVVAQDMTERIRAETALRASEQRFRELYETAQRQAQELALLDKVRTAMVQELELQELLHKVVESIAETFGYTLVSLYLLQGETLVLEHQVGYDRVIAEIPIVEGVSGRVIRTGTPVFLKDVRDDPAFLGAIEGIVSEICVPLKDEGNVVGIINVESTENVQLTEADLHMLVILSEQVGLAIGRARLYSSIQQRNRVLAALQEATLPLMGKLELSEVLQTILARASDLLGTLHGYVYLVNSDQTALDMVSGIGVFSQYVGNQLARNEGLAGNVWQTAQTVNVHDYRTWEGHSSKFQETSFYSVVGVPLIVNEYVTGVLGLAHLDPEKSFSDDAVELLIRFAQLATIALENARLYTLSQQQLADRTRAEEALRESEANLLTAQATAHLGNWVLDQQIGRGAWSPEMYRIFGIEPEAGPPTFDEFLALLHPEDVQKLLDTNTNALQTDEIISVEFRTHPERGLTRNLHALVHRKREPDGRYTLMGTVQNITRRKQAEEALRTSEERFRSLIDSATDAIIQSDEAGFITGWNQGAQNMFGYQATEVIGLPISILMPERYEEAHRAGLERILAGGKQKVIGRAVELEGLRKDRSEFPMSISWSTWTSERGQFFSAIIRDITERKLAEEQIRRRLTELEAVSRISTALRSARTLDEMLPLLLDETLTVLGAGAGSILLYDHAEGGLYPIVSRGWFNETTHSPIKPGKGIAGYVYKSGEIYRVDELSSGQQTHTLDHPQIPPGWSGVALPIHTSQEIVGVMFIAVQQPRELRDDEIRLLTTLAEITGNAIHRTRLHEETEGNLRLLASLHIIDQAITSGFDLKITLNVLINQAIVHLAVDAIAILRFNGINQAVEYTAGRGFYSAEVSQAREKSGSAFARQFARERRLIGIPNLSQIDQPFIDTNFAIAENIQAYHATPLIAKGEVIGILEVFHRKPYQPTAKWRDFFETLGGQAAIAIDNADLFHGLQRSNLELSQAYQATIESWSRVLDLRDRETEGHSQRVTELTLKLAKAMGISEAEMVHVRRGALLHDIGKMGIPDQILLKPEPLTDEEWGIMRHHPEYAYEMLFPIEYLRPALDIPYCHHEKWDGTGYPRKLMGEQIPLAARIFAVVDVWDALRSDRPYRAAWPQEKVRAYIREQSGAHFDPRVVEKFLQMIDQLDGTGDQAVHLEM